MIIQVTTYAEEGNGPSDVTKTVYFDNASEVEFSHRAVEVNMEEFSFDHIYPVVDKGHSFVDASSPAKFQEINWVTWVDKNDNRHVAIAPNTIYILNDSGKTIGRAA